MSGNKQIVQGAEWSALYARAQAIVPDAFGNDGRVLNLIEGTWGWPSRGKRFLSPCDGSLLASFPMIDMPTALRAVQYAAGEHETWARVDLDERRARVVACVNRLREQRALPASLLVWEIGKPYAQALVSVDRCISGVAWYVDQIERMTEGRRTWTSAH